MSEEKLAVSEAIFSQLAVAKRRLETYPFINPDSQILKHCMLVIIRSIAGEAIPPGELVCIGGSSIVNAPIDDSQITVNGKLLSGGIEIAPGVMQYAPDAAMTQAPITPVAPAAIPVAVPVPPGGFNAAQLFAPVAEQAQVRQTMPAALPPANAAPAAIEAVTHEAPDGTMVEMHAPDAPSVQPANAAEVIAVEIHPPTTQESE